MRLLPWKRETRDSVSYTDSVIGYLQQRSSGAIVDLSETAALEIAAGLWGRAFASAEVKGSALAQYAVTPSVLAYIGRQLVRRGEALYEIAVEDGDLLLVPCAQWHVSGEPTRWMYEVTQSGPSSTVTRKGVTPSRVIHAVYAVEPEQPWKGVSPMRVAASTSAVMAAIETRLSEEMAAQVALLIPTPEGINDTTQLRQDISNAKGKVAFAPTTQGGWGQGRDERPKNDWMPVRIGASPPPEIDPLRTSTAHLVLAACGVPIELVTTGQGTASREAYRRFLHSTIAPVGLLVAEELSRKLDAEVTLGFDALFASDLQGRARAFQSMVGRRADPGECGQTGRTGRG